MQPDIYTCFRERGDFDPEIAASRGAEALHRELLIGQRRSRQRLKHIATNMHFSPCKRVQPSFDSGRLQFGLLESNIQCGIELGGQVCNFVQAYKIDRMKMCKDRDEKECDRWNGIVRVIMQAPNGGSAPILQGAARYNLSTCADGQANF